MINTTRAENRAKYLAAERVRNKKPREARRKAWREVYFPTIVPSEGNDDDDPPPF